MNDVEDRAERRRRSWIEAYRAVGDAGAVCRRLGVSRPTLRKWLGRFELEGEAGLRARSRRPHRSPALKVGETQETLILGIRRERRLGVKRIRNELQRLHAVRLSAATIHEVLARHGLNNLPTRQRTAIDDCSRYLVAGLARRRSAAATLTFLDQVLEEMPFSVQRVQTDRGTEFFAEEVQRRLMDETIRFRPIPARSPHLNGKVERAQRTCLEEFWAATDLKASATSLLCGFITTTGTAHTSLCTETPLSTECASWQTRRRSGPQLVMPTTPRKSVSRSGITSLI